MNKKKILWLSLCLLACITGFAQTQQGVVKTRGRMVKGVLQKGTPLEGATIQIKDRSAMVSGANGKFSFPLRTNSYLLQSVIKNGYQLVDLEVCRNYQYSANPLYIVMETPDQQRSDQLAAEQKIRRNLQRQLQQKEDEIEALQASQQEKDSLLQILYQEQADNEKLIANMAKRYSTLDYDQLDEFYRQVSSFIENGELTRADSLLRTRGDVNTQVSAQLHQGQVIQKQKEQLRKAEAVHQAGNEELARRCYGYYETFFVQHQNDSAAHYLLLRAELDSTKVGWLNDAGCFINEYLAKYDDAIFLFQLALKQSIKTIGEQSPEVATCYNNLGYAYSNQGNYSKTMECYQKASDIFLAVYDSIHPDVTTAYMQMGAAYYRQADYPHAEEYLLKAWNMAEAAGNTNDEKALLCNSLALLYQDLDDAEKALDYYQKALDLFDEENADEENLTIAITYNNIGSFLSELGKNALAIEYFEKTLSIEEKVLGTNHPSVAKTYINIANSYEQQRDYPAALQLYQEALHIVLKVMGENNHLAASCYGHIGSAYDYMDSLELALKYSLKAKDIREKLYDKEHTDIANSYNNLASIYGSMGNDSLALDYYQKALVMREKLFGKEHSSIAGIYKNIGLMYTERKDYPKALDYQRKALAIYEKLFDADHPNVTGMLTTIEGTLYEQAIDENHLKEYMADKAFTATVMGDNTPAAKQGMKGEYILLEFADWTQDSPVSLFKKNDEYRGKPRDILVSKDGIVSSHHFENTIGVMFNIKQVGKEEKQRINKAYKEWKRRK